MASAFLSDSRLLFSIHSLSSSSSSSSSSSCPLSCRRSASSILIGVSSSSPPSSSLSLFPYRQRNFRSSRFTTPLPLLLPLTTTSAYSFRCSALTANGSSSSGIFTVGDFMTRKEQLHVVKPTTTVDRALEMLVENRITGFPVVDDDWKLVGVVSDYDLLALDSISGSRQTETSMFPEVDSTWKTFNEIQKLLIKTNGKVVADVMTIAPLVVRETTNLEDAARLLLETKYRRLPVVDSFGKLVGIITRGNVVRAALQIKHENEKRAQV